MICVWGLVEVRFDDVLWQNGELLPCLGSIYSIKALQQITIIYGGNMRLYDLKDFLSYKKRNHAHFLILCLVR